MTQPSKGFKLGTLSASACWFTTIALMLWSPFYALVFFILVVYGVVTSAAWGKQPSWIWRSGVILSWIGFLIATGAIFLGLAFAAQTPDFGYPSPYRFGVSLVFSVTLGGVALLPLAATSILHTWRQVRKTAQR